MKEQSLWFLVPHRKDTIANWSQVLEPIFETSKHLQDSAFGDNFRPILARGGGHVRSISAPF